MSFRANNYILADVRNFVFQVVNSARPHSSDAIQKSSSRNLCVSNSLSNSMISSTQWSSNRHPDRWQKLAQGTYISFIYTTFD